MKHTSLFKPLAAAFQISILSSYPSRILSRLPFQFQHAAKPPSSSPFCTTSSMFARADAKKGGRPSDRRIKMIRYHLSHPLLPRPLRFSRLRALRHWTIHRAAMLQRRALLATENLELERMYNAMRAANEELRTRLGDGGKLFRRAMAKQGVFGGLRAERGREGGVPVEFGSRVQTEGPGRGGWDHGWRR